MTHSVVELLGEAAKSARSFEELIDHGKELDRNYIGSRYPNFYPAGAPYEYYTKEMAEKCSQTTQMELNDDPRLPLEHVGYTPAEFRNMKKEGNPFILEVLRSGKVLYGKVP